MLFHFTRVRTESIIFLSAPRLRMRACFGDEREFGASAMQWGKAKSRMHRAVIAIVAVRYHNSQRIGFGAAVPTDGEHPYDAIRRHLVKSTHIESLALSLSLCCAIWWWFCLPGRGNNRLHTSDCANAHSFMMSSISFHSFLTCAY